jgi:superoxide dismutase, Cu-Zn family
MKNFAIALLAGALAVCLQAAEPKKVEINDANGASVGFATLTELPGGGVAIDLDLKGLPPGAHAMHIHSVAKCEAPGFTSAGGHFNPDQKQHGLENPAGHHAGDMFNFVAGADGTIKVRLPNTSVNMGTDSHSVFSNGGTALVIHASPDDMKTDPAGNAGARIACGVITK